jgi:hypothetical protein
MCNGSFRSWRAPSRDQTARKRGNAWFASLGGDLHTESRSLDDP